MNDEYEIFPHKLLEDLKYDVEALKKKLAEPETAAQEVIAEMEDLKSTIKELNNIFKEALREVKEEDTSKLLAALLNKIGAVTAQNETIARGMVAIADKLEDFMRRYPAAPLLKAPAPLIPKAPMSPRIPPPPLPKIPSPPGTGIKRKSIFG